MSRALPWLLLIVALAGWGWSVRRAGAEAARADLYRLQADSMARAAEAADASLAAHAREAEAQIAEQASRREAAEVERAAAEARTRRAAASRPAIVDSLRVLLVDSLTRAVHDEAEALYVEEVTGYQDQLAQERIIIRTLTSVVATETRLRMDAVRVTEQFRAALEASQREADAWESAARPKLFGWLPSVSPETALVAGVVVGVGVALVR